MTPRPLASRPRGPHVAIIMDGNGRWATSRRLSRPTGHQEGAKAARRIVEAARELGVGTLTLYAFSSDNWRRPPREVGALMALFRRYLVAETPRCLENGVRLNIIGRRDRLGEPLRRAIDGAERATSGQAAMHLRVALDYSARDAILRAARRLAIAEEPSREAFATLLGEVDHAGAPAPDVDLLIRTGGEQRLSDFLLWECAYAEFVFSPRMWPEFGPDDLAAAVREFAARERRFGDVPRVAS
ncbi:MAG TPA: di-trans,poly-cis-decaprenylcistransferase [Gemmatimonadaceae bacterium]|nr:di-trans,poly-cis-decaprenylcistransferase [Gemmatimonadaceae bacterium]